MLTRQADLRELGVQLVEAVLDAQVDVVERPLGHGVLAVDRRRDHLGLGDAARVADIGGRTGAADAEGRRLQVLFLAGALEVGIEHVEADLGLVRRRVLQRQGAAQALLVVLVDVEAREARVEGGVVGRLGRVDRGRQAGSVRQGVEARREGVARGPAHRRGAFVQQLALGIGHRQQGPELAVGPGVADHERAARVLRLRQVVVAQLRRAHHREALVIVERPRRAQVDGRAQRAFLGVGRRRSCAP
jgi:hypothetical protein